MTLQAINELTEYKPNNNANPYLSYLQEERLIHSFSEGKEIDKTGLIDDGITYYQINLRGRDYIENHRRAIWNFWLPYGITTALALGSLIATFVSLFR